MAGSLGSGEVRYDPDKPIIHFGSPVPESVQVTQECNGFGIA